MTSEPPSRYLLPVPGVYLPGWACAVLDRMTLDALRREVRGQHSDLDHVLGAVQGAALRFRVAAGSGSRLDTTHSWPASSAVVDTRTAAVRLHVGPRRVRRRPCGPRGGQRQLRQRLDSGHRPRLRAGPGDRRARARARARSALPGATPVPRRRRIRLSPARRVALRQSARPSSKFLTGSSATRATTGEWRGRHPAQGSSTRCLCPHVPSVDVVSAVWMFTCSGCAGGADPDLVVLLVFRAFNAVGAQRPTGALGVVVVAGSVRCQVRLVLWRSEGCRCWVGRGWRSRLWASDGRTRGLCA
jgi:hypothetical protein